MSVRRDDHPDRISRRDPPINVRLRRLRRRRELEVDVVRRVAGWPPGHLESLEAGTVAPLLSEVVALAWLYRIDLDQLLPKAGRASAPRRHRESSRVNGRALLDGRLKGEEQPR